MLYSVVVFMSSGLILLLFVDVTDTVLLHVFDAVRFADSAAPAEAMKD